MLLVIFENSNGPILLFVFTSFSSMALCILKRLFIFGPLRLCSLHFQAFKTSSRVVLLSVCLNMSAPLSAFADRKSKWPIVPSFFFSENRNDRLSTILPLPSLFHPISSCECIHDCDREEKQHKR